VGPSEPGEDAATLSLLGRREIQTEEEDENGE
jgi:hypothetical protein